MVQWSQTFYSKSRFYVLSNLGSFWKWSSTTRNSPGTVKELRNEEKLYVSERLVKPVLAQSWAVVIKGSYSQWSCWLKRQGRACLEYQVAARSVILELAVRSGKVYLRTWVGAGREKQEQSCKVQLEEMDKNHTTQRVSLDEQDCLLLLDLFCSKRKVRSSWFARGRSGWITQKDEVRIWPGKRSRRNDEMMDQKHWGVRRGVRDYLTNSGEQRCLRYSLNVSWVQVWWLSL